MNKQSSPKRWETPELNIRTTKMLLNLGIPASSQGYCYLRSAIMLAYYDPEATEYITKTLYPKVARICRACSVESVARNCRRAIDRAFVNRTETLSECFGETENYSRPTCAEFILTIAEHLHCEERSDGSYEYKNIDRHRE
ncbi:MAG: sporulation initiation factor Spo0A C-terminal domain-containing protein [Clostridia bacterium]|nr:sporulation initiation factor Spo0A C-terminal domain-containing protein [Clostridia bacterium]